MLFTSTSILSLLAVVPVAVQAVPVFSHSDGLLPRQAADLQTELALDPSQIATGSEQDGQGAVVTDNQIRSKTSTNNFANFCLTQNVALTDGLQVKAGSCNPTIMGVIASTSNMPRSKFSFPKNGQVIQADTAFTLQMKIGNLQTGNFVNPNANYYAAPQTVNGGGDIIGHSHVTIQKIDDVASPNPLDPTVFAFFKGFNNVAANGILTADVPAPGLPSGFYRMCSINAAANHQPVLVAVAQHGSLDDCVYFQCAAKASNTPFFDAAGAAGGAGAGNNNNNGNKGGDKTAASTTAAAPPAASSAAAGNNNGQKGGAQANNGAANNNNNKGQAAQQAADKAKQAADAKKAADDQKKAQDAAKAAAGANGKQSAAQQAADKAKQAADAKKAAADQKKAQQQSNANKGGKKNRRSLRFQRD